MTLDLLFKVIIEPKGYTVWLARNVEDGLSYLKDHRYPELILLDYRLGNENGIEFLNRAEALHPTIFSLSQIVLLTAFGVTTAHLPSDRFRSLVMGPRGDLYVATDSGSI